MVRTDAPRRHRGGDDAGFTLMEVIVSVAIISVVMLGLGAVFVATAAGTDAQGLRQNAARVATDGLDRARALTGAGVVKGRDSTSVGTQWTARPAGVASLLSGLSPASDPTAKPKDGLTAPLPTTTDTSTADSIVYTRSFYVADCQLTVANACVGTAVAGSTVPMYDVVVAVSWRDKSCTGGTCTYQLSTLLAASSTEPLFNSNTRAIGPTVAVLLNRAPLTNLVQDVTEPVTGLAASATGGNGTVGFTATGLPVGVTFDEVAGTFGGAVSAVTAPTTVSVTATDQFGLYSTATFTWAVNALPTIVAGTVPLVTGVTSSIDLASVLKLSGGTTGYTWACSGLPTTLTLDRTTGVVTGLVATLGLLAPSCTVTDARGKSATATLSLPVLAPLAVTSPANGTTTTITRITTVRTTLVASGCSGTCTWAADKLPTGITLDATTGVVSGKATTAGTTATTFKVTDTAGRTATSLLTWKVL